MKLFYRKQGDRHLLLRFPDNLEIHDYNHYQIGQHALFSEDTYVLYRDQGRELAGHELIEHIISKVVDRDAPTISLPPVPKKTSRGRSID